MLNCLDYVCDNYEFTDVIRCICVKLRIIDRTILRCGSPKGTELLRFSQIICSGVIVVRVKVS